MNIEPETQQQWLQRLIGEWSFHSECIMTLGQPPEQFHGTETVRPFGDLWVIGEGLGEMPGGITASTIITLGYDSERRAIVGTFLCSQMNHLWFYNGDLDQQRKRLLLYTEGPASEEVRKTVRHQDIIEFKDADHRTLTSYLQNDDGSWQSVMTADYRRKT